MKVTFFSIILLSVLLAGCSDKQGKGVGPIKSVDFGELDSSLANKGKELFYNKCFYCHDARKRNLSPELSGVTKRREPEWIMNMILNPEGMMKENKYAKELASSFQIHMYKQIDKEEESRSVYEYLRQRDGNY